MTDILTDEMVERFWEAFHEAEGNAIQCTRAAILSILPDIERAVIERCAKVVEGGRFLHDDAPAARFARECALALRSLPTSTQENSK